MNDFCSSFSENEMLWAEVGDLREQHRDQQTVINKVIFSDCRKETFFNLVIQNVIAACL